MVYVEHWIRTVEFSVTTTADALFQISGAQLQIPPDCLRAIIRKIDGSIAASGHSVADAIIEWCLIQNAVEFDSISALHHAIVTGLISFDEIGSAAPDVLLRVDDRIHVEFTDDDRRGIIKPSRNRAVSPPAIHLAAKSGSVGSRVISGTFTFQIDVIWADSGRASEPSQSSFDAMIEEELNQLYLDTYL